MACPNNAEVISMEAPSELEVWECLLVIRKNIILLGRADQLFSGSTNCNSNGSLGMASVLNPNAHPLAEMDVDIGSTACERKANIIAHPEHATQMDIQ
jgi:hypothetical protein